MFVDARTLGEESHDFDVCIVGAGAAGITLARELAGRSLRTCLLESGDLEPDPTLQELSEGEIVGLPYFPLHVSHVRGFGGTTEHWGGHCRPEADLDFERRDWVPFSGWPITRSTLEPFYEQARIICGLRSKEWDTPYWERHSKHPRLPLLGDRVVTRIGQLVYPESARRFGRVYRDDIAKATNVITYLNANVIAFETDDSGQVVTRVRVACMTGKRFTVSAKNYILAGGGIENPRLLLLSTGRRHANGLGNQHDLVGRFFLEHPRLPAGVFLPANSRLRVRLYEPHHTGSHLIRGYLGLSPAVLQAEKLVDIQIRLEPVLADDVMAPLGAPGVTSLVRLARALGKGRFPDGFGHHVKTVLSDLGDVAQSGYLWARYRGEFPLEHLDLTTRIDPAPNPDSRVTLADERDQLGLRKVRLDWRLSPIDKRSVRRALEIFGEEAGRAGLGRIQIGISEDDTTWPAELQGGWHHMGTTRMSDDPKQGVVDRNCKVHSIANLFIAGSSVFPTAGSGTPTLLIVALALRLSKHIKEIMR